MRVGDCTTCGDIGLGLDPNPFSPTFGELVACPDCLSPLRLPSHDPPVAWKGGEHSGLPVIAYPSLSRPLFAVHAPVERPVYMDPEPVILDGEPGRRSCQHGVTFDCARCRDEVGELAADADVVE